MKTGNKVSLFSLLILSLAGFLTALLLAHLHYTLNLGGPFAFQVCRKGCDVVNTSSYSEFLGVPIASYGAVVYFQIFILSLLSLLLAGTPLELCLLSLVFLISIFCVGISFLLAGISIFKLSSLCNLCGLTYLINCLLAFVSGGTLKASSGATFKTVGSALRNLFSPKGDVQRDPEEYYRKRMTNVIVMALLLSISSGLAVSFFYSEKYQSVDRGKIQKFLEGYANLQRMAVKTASSPAKGSKSPKLTIVVFSDFNCSYCRTASLVLDRLLPEYRGDLQIVYKHLPHDKTCNPYEQYVSPKKSCELSKASICAQKQGKFWEYHDLLFGASQPEVSEAIIPLAQKIGISEENFTACINDPVTQQLLLGDIEEAHRLGAQSTPTFFLNGRMIQGLPPTSLLHTLIQREIHERSNR